MCPECHSEFTQVVSKLSSDRMVMVSEKMYPKGSRPTYKSIPI